MGKFFMSFLVFLKLKNEISYKRGWQTEAELVKSLLQAHMYDSLFLTRKNVVAYILIF